HSTLFSFHDYATTEIYTLSLHDALPILSRKVSSLVNRSTTIKSVCCFFGRLIALLSNCKLTSSLVPHVEAQEENASKDLSFTVNTGAVASAIFKPSRASCT